MQLPDDLAARIAVLHAADLKSRVDRRDQLAADSARFVVDMNAMSDEELAELNTPMTPMPDLAVFIGPLTGKGMLKPKTRRAGRQHFDPDHLGDRQAHRPRHGRDVPGPSGGEPRTSELAAMRATLAGLGCLEEPAGSPLGSAVAGAQHGRPTIG